MECGSRSSTLLHDDDQHNIRGSEHDSGMHCLPDSAVASRLYVQEIVAVSLLFAVVYVLWHAEVRNFGFLTYATQVLTVYADWSSRH